MRPLAPAAALTALLAGATTGVAVAACDGRPESPSRASAAAPRNPLAPLDAEGRPPPPERPAGARADARAQSPEVGFFGAPDAAVRRSLALEPIVAVERGRGGRTLAFKVTLADGTVGYYKPEQAFSGAHWYGEVAAYYLDRELGLGRVPPVVGRVVDWSTLRPAAVGDERIDEIHVREDGTVRGAMIWWVPEGLERLVPGRRWERWIRVDPHLGITPYQRPARFRTAVSRRRDGEPGADAARRRPLAPPAPEDPRRDDELSDLILFDYLTQNVDRWGGNFTNVRTRGDAGPLVFFDNGAAFYPAPRIPLMDARLAYLQRFRRATVERIRGLSLDAYRTRLASDPLAPVLDEALLAGLAERRDHLLAHVDAMLDAYGPDAVYLPDDEPASPPAPGHVGAPEGDAPGAAAARANPGAAAPGPDRRLAAR